MTALAQEKSRRQETWRYKTFTATGAKCWKGGRACLNSTGKVVPATSTTALLAIGVFAETVDASSADAPVTVDLEREVILERFANATGGDAVLATQIGGLAYMMDDQTVTITSTGRSIAGLIWDVDAIKGVAIEKITQTVDNDDLELNLGAGGAFTSNDWAPATVGHDTVYAVPATGAASTITLPAGAPDGTRVYFQGDGTANAHTVQYRDAAGPTNLTTALTASKRHLVVAVKNGGIWNANAYVGPS